MSEHTPGPWFTSRPHGTIYIEARLRGSTLQEVAAVGPTETHGQQEANAYLIAAAPELLAALVRLKIEITLSDIDPAYIESHLRKWMDAADSAIAKAAP